MNKNNPYYNNEGYADPTAFYGTKQIVTVSGGTWGLSMIKRIGTATGGQ